MQIPFAGPPPTPHTAAAAQRADVSPLRRSAEALEAAFLSEMLKAAGLGRAPDSMNGGQGEEHFASFMADAHAQALMARGGIGLADFVERSLAARVAASSLEGEQ